ncbi:alpha/beta hydrolase [Caenimonas sedimenti]|uniref:Alpha/beta hydrolase n=1 Tax=Caenimonas sedimenti TaxID=2596921 RepID=A0A562ZIN9_9BURK|nr:alpha/beta fold hydrolase [Caenimonas sedimenti]TWO68206.1 alpha/beta hydrolase [Caenimonas sedimenti]
MANFLLVHGAWHGAWCWRRVAAPLAAQGHRVHAVTLTGVGERAHLRSPLITLETHIADVVNALDAEELEDVILAVHSYAGMLGTAVADRMPGRLRHLVYVDAVVPNPGESWSACHPSVTREARIAAAEASPDYSIPPPDPKVYGLEGSDHAWVQRRQTPHPGHTYQAVLAFEPARVASVARTFVDCIEPPLATIDISRQRVRDPSFWGGAWAGGAPSSIVELRTGHDPMVSSANELVQTLLAL